LPCSSSMRVYTYTPWHTHTHTHTVVCLSARARIHTRTPYDRASNPSFFVVYMHTALPRVGDLKLPLFCVCVCVFYRDDGVHGRSILDHVLDLDHVFFMVSLGIRTDFTVACCDLSYHALCDPERPARSSKGRNCNDLERCCCSLVLNSVTSTPQ